MTKDDIIAVLPKLPAGELKTLRAVIDRLLSQNAPTAAPDGPERWLFDAIAGALGVRLPWPVFVQGPTFKTFETHSASFIDFLHENNPGSKVASMAFTQLLIELIIKDLRNRDAPITLGSVCSNLSRVQEVFEGAFPGYIRSNVVSLIHRRMKGD